MTVRDSAARPLRHEGEERENGNSQRFQHSRGTRPKEGIPMSTIVPKVRFASKQKLTKQLRRTTQARTRVRYLIIINLLNGRSPTQTAQALGIARSTVYTVARRFQEKGEWGLLDGREDNGMTKLDEHYLTTLYAAVRNSPQSYGWRRPTWTRELLVDTLARQTGVRIHVATMSKALAR